MPETMLRPPLLSAYPVLLALCLGGVPAALAQSDGVKVGEASVARKLVSAESLEKSAVQQYGQLKQQATAKRALAPDGHPQVKRLRTIAAKLIPYSYKFNPRARDWKWEINLIGSQQINAFCMPGGKIAFYTGILETLKLTDDEVAMVMGHEVAHALREHARERMGTQMAATAIKGVFGLVADLTGYGGVGRMLADGVGNLTLLKFSRDDESESDVIGLELAARAGYDPRAGVTLWQKMTAANKGAPPSWLSTHPAGKDRIKEIQAHLPEVMPLYEKAVAGNRPS